MIQSICAWLLILWPCIKFTHSITTQIYSKEDNINKSSSITASIIVVIANYLILYFAGVFNLIK